jgi:DUF1009 family protein
MITEATLFTEPIGIIAGNRTLPLVFARQARKLGASKIVAIAFKNETDPGLEELVDELVSLNGRCADV